MIELLSISFVALLFATLYINENRLHKNKIKFDLLKDRKGNS